MQPMSLWFHISITIWVDEFQKRNNNTIYEYDDVNNWPIPANRPNRLRRLAEPVHLLRGNNESVMSRAGGQRRHRDYSFASGQDII